MRKKSLDQSQNVQEQKQNNGQSRIMNKKDQ